MIWLLYLPTSSLIANNTYIALDWRAKKTKFLLDTLLYYEPKGNKSYIVFEKRVYIPL